MAIALSRAIRPAPRAAYGAILSFFRLQREEAPQPFHRVRDDLRRLLAELPAASLDETRPEIESFVPKNVAERQTRGRPPIPSERKAAAFPIKSTRGSNRDAAKKLYNVTYPAAVQVKSTSTILREYGTKRVLRTPRLGNSAKLLF